MPNAVDYLLGDHFENSGYRLSDNVFQGHRIDLFPAEISREKHLAYFIDYYNHSSFGRNRIIIDVGVTFGVAAAFHYFFNLFRQQLSVFVQRFSLQFACQFDGFGIVRHRGFLSPVTGMSFKTPDHYIRRLFLNEYHRDFY